MELLAGAVNGVHHITLSVTDVTASAWWYQRLLGPANVIRRQGPDWERIRMDWPNGLVIGVTRHVATPEADAFSPLRVGLDHISLACPTEADVRSWATRLDELGMLRGPVEDMPYGWAVTARDPDGIAVEFFCDRTT